MLKTQPVGLRSLVRFERFKSVVRPILTHMVAPTAEQICRHKTTCNIVMSFRLDLVTPVT